MQSEPILSIAVPTYNRPHKLSDLLHSIARQYKYGMAVEVFICDNSNGTESLQIAKEYSQKIPIRYIKHNQNIGVTRNVLFAAENSAGAYCWLAGDDDMILPGAIEKILAVLNEQKGIRGIVCGYTYVKEDDRNAVIQKLDHHKSFPEQGEDNVFRDTTIDRIISRWEDTFYDAHLPGLHTSILSCVFNKVLWLENGKRIAGPIAQLTNVASDPFQSVLTTFPHSLTWGEMFIGHPVYMISRPMSCLCYGHQEWLSQWPFLMFTRNLELADIYLTQGADKSAVNYYKNLILSDQSLRQVLTSLDPYITKNFSLSHLLLSNLESAALWHQIRRFAFDSSVPIHTKFKIAILPLHPKIFAKLIRQSLKIIKRRIFDAKKSTLP